MIAFICIFFICCLLDKIKCFGVCRSRIRSADAMDLLVTIFASQIDSFTPKAKETMNPFSEVLLQELRNASSLSFPMLNNLVLVLGRYLVDKRLEDGIFREQLVKTGLEVWVPFSILMKKSFHFQTCVFYEKKIFVLGNTDSLFHG